MATNEKKDQKKQAEAKAAWKTTTLFIVFGSLIFAVFWWARTNDESEVAWKIRNLLGIQLVDKPAEEAADNKPLATDQIDDEPAELEPGPEPVEDSAVVEAAPEPEPEAIQWPAFRKRSDLWPKTLNIMVDQEVTLLYQGTSYGEVTFQSGQPLSVINLSENGYVFGRTGGNEMEVHVSETNFATWFEQTHGDLYEITVPEKETNRLADDFEDKLITELRIWCLKNYQTPLVEINEDHLVLRWHSRSRGDNEANYSLEALSVARAYLRIQAELGGEDNYASCEVRDPDTGQLMGSKGIFIPRF
ncbi:hypothetical protein DDZ13_11285 [Coraliomargarita sinensis]|uniref:Uncharacterized protein n=1 Tax=Coraliomargarita sinensis TaxID=2174842 RepID=A0A317ZHV4_9BACT|nr:hypothetical protein [Coraliomargarita sinensis]PXA03558.1 hypothetical protein DDZ13_11285 [Coraliomargarita sinensis]